MTETRRDQLAHVNRVLTDEFAQEAARFLQLHQRLRAASGEDALDEEAYATLEGQLYASIVHLKVHAATLQDSLDDLTDADVDVVER